MGGKSSKDGKHEPPEQTSAPENTEEYIDKIAAHITDLGASVKTLKGCSLPETKAGLSQIVTKTEQDIQELKKSLRITDVGQQEKENEVGTSTFYTSLNQDEQESQIAVESGLSKHDELAKSKDEKNNKGEVLTKKKKKEAKKLEKRKQKEEEQKQIENLKKKMEDMKNKKEELEHEKNDLERRLMEAKENLEKEESKNAELLFRLSKVAGEKLVKDNPAIADLNDQNRPTKLGEVYSELYDNEWTDAFSALEAEGHNEQTAILTLYETLLHVYDFCVGKSETMLQKTGDAVNFLFEEYKRLHITQASEETKRNAISLSLPKGKMNVLFKEFKESEDRTLYEERRVFLLQQKWKLNSPKTERQSAFLNQKLENVFSKIKALRKETAESMVPMVQKAYLKASWIDGEFIPELKPYIRKCIFLCWMMVVQSPQMTFQKMDDVSDAMFDKSVYREYTASGPNIKFIVWPPLLLHENGPLISKGVAQGCNHAKKENQ